MSKAKRFVALGLVLAMSIMTLVGCSKGESAGKAANATEEDGALHLIFYYPVQVAEMWQN